MNRQIRMVAGQGEGRAMKGMVKEGGGSSSVERVLQRIVLKKPA